MVGNGATRKDQRLVVHQCKQKPLYDVTFITMEKDHKMNSIYNLEMIIIVMINKQLNQYWPNHTNPISKSKELKI